MPIEIRWPGANDREGLPNTCHAMPKSCRNLPNHAIFRRKRAQPLRVPTSRRPRDRKKCTAISAVHRRSPPFTAVYRPNACLEDGWKRDFVGRSGRSSRTDANDNCPFPLREGWRAPASRGRLVRARSKSRLFFTASSAGSADNRAAAALKAEAGPAMRAGRVGADLLLSSLRGRLGGGAASDLLLSRLCPTSLRGRLGGGATPPRLRPPGAPCFRRGLYRSGARRRRRKAGHILSHCRAFVNKSAAGAFPPD
jgi:hypothetical protein